MKNQNQTDKATPRPWDYSADEIYVKRDGKYHLVASTVSESFCEKERKSNAALIVKAVNEHDALEAVAKSHETLLLALNEVDRRWLASSPTSARFIRASLAEGEKMQANLAAIRGQKVEGEK